MHACYIVRRRIADLRHYLETALSHEEFSAVFQFSQKCYNHNFRICQEQKNRKFRGLFLKESHEYCRSQRSISALEEDKLLVNLSSQKLSDKEKSLLCLGGKYGIAPKNLPLLDLTARMEYCARILEAKSDLPTAAAFRLDISQFLLQKSQTPRLPLSLPPDLNTALKSLQRDKDRVFLTADKSNTMVVLDATYYNTKISELLETSGDYEKLANDPSARFVKQLDKELKSTFSSGIGIRELQQSNPRKYGEYQSCLKTYGRCAPFYALPKIHKLSHVPTTAEERVLALQQLKFRPITPSFDTADSATCQYLTRVISSLPKSQYSVLNSQDFITKLKDVNLNPGDIWASFDVTALFTKVPVDEACNIILTALRLDVSLAERTSLSPEEIVRLLKFCHMHMLELGTVSFVSCTAVLWESRCRLLLPSCSWVISSKNFWRSAN